MSKICPVCGTTYSDANAFCPADGTTLRAAEVSADLIGTVVADRYLVTDLLGEGGMGKVYLARHVRLPQQAAIKVLRHNMLKDAAAVARFTREAASASRIDHDRVARVYDFGETSDGTVYLAMEFVPGRTLKKLLADTGPLEPRRAAGIVRQIAEGMDAAHRLGIVHRDLKPDNVIVVEDADGSERVKVVDFGIAKALGADEGAGLTQAGYVVGTPEFMSPEQLLGGAVDARSDVYALAIIAYQCLTASFPFDTSTLERIMAARLTQDPLTLAQAQPAVGWPAEIQAVLDAGLAREVEHRSASAGTFARALAEAIEHWRPASPGMRPLVTPRVVAAVPAAAESAPAPTGAASVAAPPAPATYAPPRSSAPAPAPAPLLPPAAAPVPVPASVPKRSAMPMVAVAGGLVAVLAGAGAFFVLNGRDPAAAPAPAASDSLAIAPTQTQVPALPAAVPAATPPPTPPATQPSAAPVASAPAPAGPAPSTPRPAAAGADDADVAARRTLDSITAAFDPDRIDEAGARAAVPVLEALLPRLRAEDRTWAQLRLVEAHALSDDTAAACRALRGARAAATTGAQREAARRWEGPLGC
jgi:serine/threonine-protein kinase